mmetsp:Transcript_17643/g.28537  ORF Transcript_17643/g.28537 Transcript_17643/m.28537 type:complete len:217 (-) Transcript_17643:233-883(-)
MTVVYPRDAQSMAEGTSAVFSNFLRPSSLAVSVVVPAVVVIVVVVVELDAANPLTLRSPSSPSSSSFSTTLNEGKVYGIDVIPQLVELSKTNISKQDRDLLLDGSSTVHLLTRDGWKGYPEGAPYHAIHVGAAAATFPRELMKQLTVGGVMVVPVGPDGGTQYLYMVERVGDAGVVVGLNNGDGELGSGRKGGFREEDYKVQKVLGVRYVPLVRSD